MVRRWLRERRKDEYYRKAKREGYRSRASYKLLQIHEKFRLFREGDRVVDLGAAPGGWSQVAVELVGEAGTVVGVDLAPIEDLEGATFLRGDMTDPATVARVLETVGGDVDLVLSDMSPNISGVYSVDHARSIALVEAALAFAGEVLRPGGKFVAKVFEGDLFGGFLDRARASFGQVKVASPDASRDASSEVYVVAMRFSGRPGPPPRSRPPATGWREGQPIGDYE